MANKRSTNNSRKNQDNAPQPMTNYIDDQIGLNDYSNLNSRKQNLNNTAGLHSAANGVIGNVANMSRTGINTQQSSGNRHMSKTSIDQNPNYYNGDSRKSSKGSKVRQSHGVVTKNQLYTNNPHAVNASQDLINFKTGQSPAT